MSSASIDLRDCSRSVRRLERVLHCGVDVHGRRREWRQVGGLDPDRPEVRRVGIEDQRAECVFGVTDIPFRDDHRLLATCHFCFGLDDVDGRCGADFDPGARIAERFVCQIQRLSLHAERRDRVGEVPERVAHGARRHGDRLPKTDVGDLAVLRGDEHLLPRVVDLPVSQQRLRVVQRERRSKLGRERRERAVGVESRAVPPDVVAATPRQRLRHADVAEDLIAARDGALRAGQEVLVRGIVAVGRERRAEVGRPTRLRVDDIQVLDLRVDAGDPDTEVVLERQADRLVSR